MPRLEKEVFTDNKGGGGRREQIKDIDKVREEEAWKEAQLHC